MEVEVVQETPLTPHSEHSYSKLFDGIEPAEEKMDIGGSPMLASLDASQDTFETFLLLLLKSFTSQQRKDSDISLQPSDSADISVEALDTLSSEQVQVLTTSSSVNYDTINQIRQRQQARNTSPSKSENNNTSEAVEPSDSSTSVAPTAMDESSTGESQLQQIQKFQVTPEQLKQLELQVTELLQSQKIVLPPDITPEQQQEVIQALLLRQLRLQQASTRSGSGEDSNGGGNRMIVGLLQGEGEAQGQERSEEKQEAAMGPSKETSTGTQTLSTSTATQSTKPSTSTRGRKKEQETRKEPKKPPMPYNLFFSEVYSTVLAANPKMGFSEASKIISMMWNAMGSDAKQRYFSKHDELKQEYKAAVEKHLAANKKAAELEAKMEAKTDTKTDTKTDVVATKMQTGSEIHEARSMEEPVNIKLEPNTEVRGRGDAQQDMETGETNELKDPSLCARVGCNNAAVFAEERGPRYCSNKCVIEHCRQVFNAWPAQRNIQT